MKILHLIKSLGRGGAEMLLQETLKQHDRSKFEFHYIYFLPWKDQMVEGLRKEGGIVINIPAKNNRVIISKTARVINYIKEHKIDLVHCHLPWAGFVGRYIHKRTGIPVLYTEHNKQERYHFITRYINKFTFNYQTAVIAVSADVATSIKNNIHPKIPVQTILNGADTMYFKRDVSAGKFLRDSLNIPQDAIVIGTIAVFRFQKRLKEWILLYKRLKEKHPKVYGCIVGDGILNEEIRAFVKEQGMEDAILMPGLQTNVIPWLSAMDIFMMTSEFEGLPIALLEAMSMECAVVCTNAGGIKELIRDRVDGFLTEVENWEELMLPLEELVTNPQTLSKWGANARKRVTDSFSMKTMVEQTEKLYLETVD